MTELRTFDEITAADADAVGGKGLSLGLMAVRRPAGAAGLLRHQRGLPPLARPGTHRRP